MADSNDAPTIPLSLLNGKNQTEFNSSGYFEDSPSAKATDATDENVDDDTFSSDGTNGEKRKKPAVTKLVDRQKFVNYWKCAVNAFGITHEGMMLKKDALEKVRKLFASSQKANIHVKECVFDGLGSTILGFVENDREDILTLLLNHIPFPVDTLIELGAGIGRLTFALQPLTKVIVAVDFLQEYIEENKKSHYDAVYRPKDDFICADAVKFERPLNSFDVVFWNWLLMYFTDEEVNNFILKAFSWVKLGGFLFCRESCGQPSDGNTNRPWAIGGNPTSYRQSSFYTDLLTRYLGENGFGMRVLCSEKCVSTYSKNGGNSSQIMWLIQRTF
ncbi:methyltransferase domain-containing protein [Cardiosporidium cionae]|uniref:phosphoethanolamine N-methyltransferase n=1 Tax=Cardiosporidium cionae TaxID=476202 RepID=A0ABQ7JEK1_9APIC|nr:methyltransferase domain-containing protein [Cardiosporidium cionae]|eukprot:KAF8822441.1 methyltransferase domain-containing protein [Cardiosporidium cionae]